MRMFGRKRLKLISSGKKYVLRERTKDDRGMISYDFVRRAGLTKKLMKIFYESELLIDQEAGYCMPKPGHDKPDAYRIDWKGVEQLA
jgi:hypothetical protein